ncbi:hypothetical protein ZMTM_16560 [Methyloradius palustris]|uniref:Toxin CptA n=2 Tax=Methyloradius palustris TaxID=2778876 RepID=A0A8D5G058_9PROT|nr:hypothetical protein ZMTM_16560 [Methyloradius palustris]
MLVIACMPLLLWLKALLILLVILSSAFYIARDALGLLPWSWVALEIDSQHQFQLTAKNGVQHTVTVLPESLVASYLIVLQLKVEQPFLRKSLILLPDNANPDDLRRLRVWLKWASHKSNDAHAELEDAV